MATRSSAPASASKSTKTTPATPVAKPSGAETSATAALKLRQTQAEYVAAPRPASPASSR